MTTRFDVRFLEEAHQSLENLDDKAKEKIIYNIHKARIINNHELFKKLKGEIWEFRTLHLKTHYRLFAFWDKSERTDTLVISTHGIIKKTDKTPGKEIDKAERLRKLYFEQKNK